MKPIDSSSGVVWALPTTKLPAPSTMNVSVIVPPASIASTRGSRSGIPHLLHEPIEPNPPDSSRLSPETRARLVGFGQTARELSVALTQLHQPQRGLELCAAGRHRAAEAFLDRAQAIGDGVLVDAEQRRRG